MKKREKEKETKPNQKEKILPLENKSWLEKFKQRNPNRDILLVTYIFIGIFILLLGNYTYFIFVQSKSVINNSYNYRQDLLAERVVRGKILGSRGEVLAETVTDSAGNEVRKYPYNGMFAHVVGRFAKGRTGIEQSDNFNLLVSNTNFFKNVVNELAGNKNIGDNIVSTLDVKLQKVAYEALGNYKGAIVAMEPDTGKILVMVSKPDYDPNQITKNWDRLVEDSEKNSALINRATQGLYPPGSTFKILTALSYIRQNSDYNKYQYNCKGKGLFEGETINCYGNKVHGEMSLEESFAKSCNTSFANIGLMLDKEQFRQMCNGFLFNQALPTNILYKQSSFVIDKKSKPFEMSQTAIGQGKTQISPFHNALIVSAIANGGTLMKPYVVDRIENASGEVVKKYMPSTDGEWMTPKESNLLTSYMVSVVEKGTGTKLKGLSYSAAGKTGSAEFNSSKESHSWFVGFAPANEPKISVSIIVEGAGTGSEYAVPIAKKIFDAYLSGK